MKPVGGGFMSRWSRLFCLGCPCFQYRPLLAQKEPRQTLTPAKVEQIREAGIDPDERIKLYTKFVDEHVDTINGLTKPGALVRTGIQAWTMSCRI